MKFQSSLATEVFIRSGYLTIQQEGGEVHLTREQIEPIISEIRKLVKARKQAAPKSTAIRPEDVSESTWADFLHIRKANKAPLTETALKGIRREADKARWTMEQALQECVMRGWRGFNADWVEKSLPSSHPSAIGVHYV